MSRKDTAVEVSAILSVDWTSSSLWTLELRGCGDKQSAFLKLTRLYVPNLFIKLCNTVVVLIVV